MPFAPPFHVDIDRAKLVYYLASLDMEARWFALHEFESRQWFDQEWVNSGIALIRASPSLMNAEQRDYIEIIVQHPRFLEEHKTQDEQEGTQIISFSARSKRSTVLEPAPWIEKSSFHTTIPNDYARLLSGFNLPFNLQPQASPSRGLETFRRSLARGDITSVLQDDDGALTEVPAHFWNSDCSWQVLSNENITAHPRIGNERLKGKIFVPYRSFEGFFSKELEYFKQRQKVITSQLGLDLPDGIAEFLAQYGYKVSRSDTTESLNNRYIPGYMAFMLKALEALQIRPNKKIRIEDIKRWLLQNWPAEFGEPEDRKVRAMATFLRPPGDQAGGYYVEDRGGQNLIGKEGDTP